MSAGRDAVILGRRARPTRGIAPMPPHSDLPIIRLDPEPRRSTREKYGAVYFLGIGGLVVLIGLIAWFAREAWSLRDVWANVYRLHDPARPDAERIEAAAA